MTTNSSSPEEDIIGMENTAIFTLSSFQYIILAFVFSQGPPYRTRIWENMPFLLSLIFLGAITAIMVLNPTGWMISGFELAIYLPDWSKNVLPIEMAVPQDYRNCSQFTIK
jgi:magnesium-transporting ATPase (P-type)